jgi:hypothetical protein
MGSNVPSHVSRQWFSLRGASLSSFGSWRAQFPALSGTTKALRLPIRVSTVAYLVRSRCPRDPPFVRARLSAPGRAEVSSGPGSLLAPATPSPACSRVDANGISQVFRRSFLCLCSVPGPRSNRHVLALTAASMLPPLSGRRRLRRWLISGLTRKLRHLLSYASRFRCRHVQSSLPAGRLGLCRAGVEPAGSLREVSARVHDHPPLLLS